MADGIGGLSGGAVGVCSDTLQTLSTFLTTAMTLVSVARIKEYDQTKPSSGGSRTKTVFGVVVRDVPVLTQYFTRALDEPLTTWLGSGGELQEFALTMHWQEHQRTESFVFKLQWTDMTPHPPIRALYAARNKDAELIKSELSDMQDCFRKLQVLNTIISTPPPPDRPSDIALSTRSSHPQTKLWQTAVSSDLPPSASTQLLPIKTVVLGVITVHVFAVLSSLQKPD